MAVCVSSENATRLKANNFSFDRIKVSSDGNMFEGFMKSSGVAGCSQRSSQEKMAIRLPHSEPVSGVRHRALQRLGLYVPESLHRRDMNALFQLTESLRLPQIPFSAGSVESGGASDQGLTVLGMQNGDLVYFPVSGDGGEIFHPSLHPTAVRGITCAKHSSIVTSCSDAGLNQLDVSTNKIVAKFVPEDDVAFRQVKVSASDRVLITGTRSGNIYVLDRSDGSVVRAIYGGHASTKLGKRKSRKQSHPPVSSLQWVDDSVFATASSTESTVKFWDLRHTKKCLQTVNTGAPRQGVCSSGIAALATHDGYIWALDKAARLSACSPDVEHPWYQDSVAGVVEPTSYSHMVMIPGNETGGADILVATGKHHITTIGVPSKKACFGGYSVVAQASSLDGTFSEATTGLVWQSRSRRLVAVTDDGRFLTYSCGGVYPGPALSNDVQ